MKKEHRVSERDTHRTQRPRLPRLSGRDVSMSDVVNTTESGNHEPSVLEGTDIERD